MIVDLYEDTYFDDVSGLIKKFHAEYLSKHDDGFDECLVTELIEKNRDNTYLIINGNRCVGVLSGVEMRAGLSDKKIFQEIFFFIDEGFGKYMVWFINQTQLLLKKRGFSIIVMAVLGSSKSERIENIYTKMGFKYLETHYMRSI